MLLYLRIRLDHLLTNLIELVFIRLQLEGFGFVLRQLAFELLYFIDHLHLLTFQFQVFLLQFIVLLAQVSDFDVEFFYEFVLLLSEFTDL